MRSERTKQSEIDRQLASAWLLATAAAAFLALNDAIPRALATHPALARALHPIGYAVYLAVGLVVLEHAWRRKAWIRPLGASALAAAMAFLIKAVTLVPRPSIAAGLSYAGSSFPSAHAAVAASLLPSTQNRWMQLALIAIIISRLCVHHPLDIVAGIAIGLGWNGILQPYAAGKA
ncbi:hypothetical protein COV94_00585 [Candidatus Woesearchaeota archaeon CG11_big_fil_rev_8_21_14_0_20_57_5]|nr:MAG: hypothetical protein COV94_00585 [Candidatus Woesearchaeota archaeon CG11_big_fil_rev_8_21_14_0_20_57_5]